MSSLSLLGREFTPILIYMDLSLSTNNNAHEQNCKRNHEQTPRDLEERRGNGRRARGAHMGGGKEERAYHRGEEAVMGGEGRGTKILKEKGMSQGEGRRG